MKRSLHVKSMIIGLFILIMIPKNIYAQKLWEKYEGNPVIPEAPWINRAGTPVVIFEDQVFKMWFTAEDKIGYAESTDGIEWILDTVPVIPPAPPGAWDEQRGASSVIRINDTLKMWYMGSNDPNGWEWAIGYAWSTDNTTWEVYPDPVLEKGEPGAWDEIFVINPSVHFDGQTYHMWYAGKEGLNPYQPTLIGYATSDDGIHWEKDTINNPVMLLGDSGTFYDKWIESARVLYHDSIYHMWFTGWDGTNTYPWQYYRIGYATSQYGISWDVQNDDLPVLNVGESGSWDDSWVRHCSVIFDENEGNFKMWYDGTQGGFFSNLKIGYAYTWLEDIAEFRSEESISVFPNPASGNVTLRFSLNKNQFITVDLYSSCGLNVMRVIEEKKSPGEYEVEIDMSDLPAGIYLLRLNTKDGTQTTKLIRRR